MALDEDDCRIRKGDGAHNFAVLHRIALNLVKQEKSDKKTSVRIKRLAAGCSTDYLQTLLGLLPLRGLRLHAIALAISSRSSHASGSPVRARSIFQSRYDPEAGLSQRLLLFCLTGLKEEV